MRRPSALFVSFVSIFVSFAIAHGGEVRRDVRVASQKMRTVVTSLGPTALPDGDMGMTSLRLFNPHPFGVKATIGGVAFDVAPGSLLDTDAFTGAVVVESDDLLVVTARTSDASDAAGNEPSLDVQTEGRIETANVEASATVAITTSSVACRNGTSWARVAPVAGATYNWTTVNTNVVEGAGTNLVKLAHTAAPSASVFVTVTANGTSSTGSASISLREPFRIASFFASPTTAAPGEPVTLSWSYAGNEHPRSQMLRINGVPVAVDLTARSYIYTPSTPGQYSAELTASAAGKRNRLVRRHTSQLPPASSCNSDVRTTSFAVSDACTPGSGSVNVVASTLAQGETSLVIIKALGAWSISSDLGNALSRTAGIGNATVNYTATNAGNDTVRLRLAGACAVTDSVTISVPVPRPHILSFTASPSTISFGTGSVIAFSIENVVRWELTSSLGNAIIGTQTGNTDGDYSRIYLANQSSGVDNLKLTITGSSGETVTSTVQITITN